VPPLPGKDDLVYWANITAWAEQSGSDGCTHAAEVYVSACHEHDFHCVYHSTWFGDHISSKQAAVRLKQVHQWKSPFGRLSPMAQWRWLMVRYFGPQWD
jgi:hypothetical protein